MLSVNEEKLCDSLNISFFNDIMWPSTSFIYLCFLQAYNHVCVYYYFQKYLSTSKLIFCFSVHACIMGLSKLTCRN